MHMSLWIILPVRSCRCCVILKKLVDTNKISFYIAISKLSSLLNIKNIMQIPKETVRQTLLKCARQEFRKKGFIKANMREIAQKSGISTGNIYNYFPGKDELFREVVSPTIEHIEMVYNNYDDMDYINDPDKWGLEYHFDFIQRVVLFIDKHRDNLKLLLFKSQGSELEGYKEELIERYTAMMIKSMHVMREMNPDAVKDVSHFFIHTISSTYANVFTELLMHDLPPEEMLKNMNELMLFMFNGWNSFLNKDLMFKHTEENV